MTPLLWTLTLALGAGLSIPLGALASTHARFRSLCVQHEVDSFVSYFGGGALVAAVAMVLIPDGLEATSVPAASSAFLVGSVLFWQLSTRIERRGGSFAQMLGMLLDFVPEAIALGAASASGSDAGLLLAGLIVLQNLPEGFASFHEMRESGTSGARSWAIFLLAPLAGPLAAGLGYGWLDPGGEPLGLLMLFCSGGILYLVFEDIVPGAHLRHESFPALGAVLGFLLGMIGTTLTH